MVTQNRYVLLEMASRLQALTEELEAKGRVDPEALPVRRDRARRLEMVRMQEQINVELSDVADKRALTGLPEIDCESRLHLCKARCCSFDFVLSAQDLDERVVEWDYGRPYHIRRRPEDRYCVHNRGQDRQCTIYADRPAPCRQYDCRDDNRIWSDFERRIPATDEKKPEAAPPCPESQDGAPAPLPPGGPARPRRD